MKAAHALAFISLLFLGCSTLDLNGDHTRTISRTDICISINKPLIEVRTELPPNLGFLGILANESYESWRQKAVEIKASLVSSLAGYDFDQVVREAARQRLSKVSWIKLNKIYQGDRCPNPKWNKNSVLFIKVKPEFDINYKTFSIAADVRLNQSRVPLYVIEKHNGVYSEKIRSDLMVKNEMTTKSEVIQYWGSDKARRTREAMNECIREVMRKIASDLEY